MSQLPEKKNIQYLLEGLNSAQKKAVTHGQDPLLIIAGAGTGKTKVITHRIAYLIASKLAKPEEILAVTFTEKAANEMEERVDLLIPYSYSFVEISTFNSFGEKVLRNYGLEIGLPPDFKLLDEIEQIIFFREHLFQFPLNYFRPLSSPSKYIQDILSTIKRLKQEDIKPEEYLNYGKQLIKDASDQAAKENALKHMEMAQVYKRYQEILRKEGKIDFEDQVCLVVELFRQRPSVLQEFQERYKYILVDEFQDTNYIQFELLKLLAAKHKNLTVCGDDDQSIFRFRGASLSNILNFQEFYPEAKKIVLTKNYRSSQAILDSAYQLIKHNDPFRLESKYNINKKLEASAKKEEDKSIHLLQFDNVSHETDKVAEIIQEKIEEGYSYGEIAILVRRNADAEPFLRSLNMKEIPYRFSGSRGLYAQDEVKILVSFIKAVTDFEDSKSLFYLALSPVYQIDPYDLTLVSNYAHKKNIPLHQVFKEIYEGKKKVDISATTIQKINKIFQDLLYFIQLSASQNAGRVLYSFLERTGYLKSLVEGGRLQDELKLKNIRLFFDKVKNFSQLSKEDSIYAFADYLDLLQEVGDNPATAEAELEEDAVQVLTVHKAKGLEFTIVFMVGLIADRFPGRDRKEKIPIPDEILKEALPPGENYLQEERRLFYVAMTRAKKHLYLTWARDYGLKRLKKISPFVLEAFDLLQRPEETLRSSVLEEIKRYSPQPPSLSSKQVLSRNKLLTLSYFQVDDYLTCPLKYKFRHIMKIPILPSHTLVFGRVLHNTINFYLKKRKMGKKISQEELLQEYEKRWINEGYLSREHEEMRKKAGELALRQFYRREEKQKAKPGWLEEPFKWQTDNIKFIGRWDRVDITPKGAVIIDYKATQVKDQKEADQKTKKSLQMDLYALSFIKSQNIPLLETRLHFLESDLVGRAQKKEKEILRAMAKIKEAEEGIRRQHYEPKPDWHNCRLCEFRLICLSSYVY